MADIFIYSMIEWHYRWQRPQQIPTALASNGHRIFYLSNSVGVAQVDRPYTCVYDHAHEVFLVAIDVPGAPPNPYVGILSDLQARSIAKTINAITRDFGLVDPVGIVQHPFWAPVLDRLPGQFIIYDCMDHHAGFGDEAPHLADLERRTIKRADHVVATSAWIADQIDHPRISRIPNGVDLAHFERTSSNDKTGGNRPRIGYYGAIAHWFDFELVAQIARSLPTCDFVLAGEVTSDEVRCFDGLNNIQLLGEIPYNDVPSLAATFDVALIPFKIIDLTLATNPVKIFEYAALGLPVVATDLPELSDLPSSVVSRVTTVEEAIDCIQNHLADQDLGQVELRKHWARRQTWADRARSFEEILSGRPLVSIVVLAYNKIELTRACLEAIRSATSWPHEIVVVDNASSDSTAEFLKSWELESSRNRAVISPSNLGFAGGNNLGIKMSQGEIIVMMNNDTEPANGWLAPLVRTLVDDSRVGIVGPATNNSGNESRIYLDEKQRSVSVEGFLESRPPQFLETNSLAFFCVALRREVLDVVGELDTAFGIGMFEDDDYCNRLRQRGYTVGVNFRSFVYHHMSASFNELGSRKNELFVQNKAIYEAKWGEWIPHRHLTPLPNSPTTRLNANGRNIDVVCQILASRLERVRDEYYFRSQARELVENERVRLLEALERELAETSSRFDEQMKVMVSLRHQLDALNRSRAFKIGRAIVAPLKIIKRVFRLVRK